MQNIDKLLLKQTGNRASTSWITKFVCRSYDTNHLEKPALRMNVKETVKFSEHVEQRYTVTVTKRLHSPYQLVNKIRLSFVRHEAFNELALTKEAEET